jgi:hypothetical protein
VAGPDASTKDCSWIQWRGRAQHRLVRDICAAELADFVPELRNRVAPELGPRLQTEQLQKLIVLDAEDLVFLGGMLTKDAVVDHQVEQPFCSRLALPLVIAKRLPVADDHQAGACLRIDRFDPPPVHDRDFGELMQLELARGILRRRRGVDEIRRGRRHNEPRKRARQAAHDAALRRKKPIR